MKVSLYALMGISLITIPAHGMDKILKLLQPLDEQRIENYIHGYNDVFDATTPMVTFNKQEYQRTQLPKEDAYEQVRLELPLFYLVKYVVELRRKQIYSLNDKPTYEFQQTNRGYQLTTPGKIVALVTVFIILKTILRR